MHIESVGSAVRRGRPESRPHPAVEGCMVTCRRCAGLAGLLTTDQFAWRGASGSTIGEHLRHCAEHFIRLFDDLDSGVVDYDARERNARLERDPAFFGSVMEAIAGQLGTMGSECLARPIHLRALASPGTEPVLVQTSLERELVFLSSHNIHHLALAIGVAGELGIRIPAELGWAFSTAAHRGQWAGA
jgi:hypothetical protein